MKKILLAIILLISATVSSHAQFSNVYIGVNGLTCSQCSRTVEMRIRKLDFVADVEMNLQHTEGKIILKKDKKADMESIAQAVVDAGFSVRYLSADLHVDNTIGISGQCFVYKNDAYVFNAPPKEQLKGEVKLKFLGKKFMPKNELKKLPDAVDAKCTGASGKQYRVTIM